MTQQLTLSFERGLTAQYKSLRQVCAATVYASRKGVVGVAGDLDMSHSELSKRLAQDSSEPRPLRVEDVEAILASTGDFRPIYWLIEKFLRDPTAQREHAIAQLAALAPQLSALIEQAGLDANALKRGRR